MAAAFACALLGATAASADNIPFGQYIQFTEDGGGSTSLAGGGTVYIDMGLLQPLNLCGVYLADKPQDKRGRNDQFFPSTTVYIVEHGSIDPHAYDEDLKDAADSPNVILSASGGLFIDELIGTGAVKYPDLKSVVQSLPGGSLIDDIPDIGIHPLPAGTYDVIYDECEDGAYQSRMDAMFENAISVDYSTPLPSWPSGNLVVQKLAAFAAQKATEKTSDYVKKMLESGYAAASVTDPTVKYVKSLGTKTLFADPGAVAVQSLVKLGEHYKGIAQDPPDPAFRQVTVIPALPAAPARNADPLVDAAGQLGAALAAEDAFAAALIHAAERYQGAVAGNDLRWALVHAREVQDISALLAAQLEHKHAAIVALRTAIVADTRPIDARAAELQAYVEAVKAHGLTEDTLRQAANYGFGPSQLEELRLSILADDTPGFSKAALLAQLDALVAGDTDLQAAMAGFGAAMQPIVDQLHASPAVLEVNPLADAGGPYNATTASPLALDASATTSGPYEITKYEWDLDGDGAFDDATGATPSYTYTRGYDGLVAVKVTNENTLSSVAYAPVTVVDSNHPPAFVATSPAADPELIVGDPQMFAATAADPDGDAVAIHWLVDGVDTGATGSVLAYTAAGIGVHTVVARAVDSKDAFNERLWTVSVLALDGDGDGWNANVDCADGDPDVHPRAVEVVGNQIDDDCDAGTPDDGSAPKAAIDHDRATAGLATAFHDVSTDANDDIVSRSWDFGDLTPVVTTKNPSHTFAATGSYTVSLTVTDATGKSDSKTITVVVTEAPVADFTFAPPAPAVGALVEFTDASHEDGGSITGWSWAFGDGSTSAEQNPTHAYLTPGDYDVTLTITDAQGLQASVTKTVSTATPDPASAPVALFDPMPTDGGRNVASLQKGASIVDFSSKYDDARHPRFMLSDSANNDSLWITCCTVKKDQEFAIIKLVDGGPWQINRVKVQGRECCPDQRVEDFDVDVSATGSAASDFHRLMSNDNPNDSALHDYPVAKPERAAFLRYVPSMNYGSCCYISTQRFMAFTGQLGNATVAFKNLSSNAVSSKWTFGDGGTSTAANPTHTYAGPGAYHVTLTVKSADGRTSTYALDQNVVGPKAAFTYTPPEAPVNFGVTFTDASTEHGFAIAKREWDFGDGGTSTARNPIHVYLAGGTYTVKLKVTDADGNTDTATKSVTIGTLTAPLVLFDPRIAGGQRDEASNGGIVTASSTRIYNQPVSTLTDGDLNNGQWWSNDRSAGQYLRVQLPGSAPRAVDAVAYAGPGCGWWEQFREVDIAVSATGTDPGDFVTAMHATLDCNGGWKVIQLPQPLPVRFVEFRPTAVQYDGACCYSASGIQVLTGADSKPGEAVTFQNLSVAADAYHWTFGDGTSSDETSPVHTYTAPGDYAVTLTATAGGVSRSYTATQHVRGSTADFTYSPAAPTTDDDVLFSDTSTHPDVPIVSWSWTFGDGTTGSGANIRHAYAAAGAYTVELTIKDADGIVSSKSKTVTVTSPSADAPPVAFFNPKSSSGRNLAVKELGASIVAESAHHCCDQYSSNAIITGDPNDGPWLTPPNAKLNQWTRIQLSASPRMIDRIRLNPSGWWDQVQDFQLGVSTTTADASAFTTVLRGTTVQWQGEQTFVLPKPVLAKYVELRVLTGFVDWTSYLAVQQLRVYTGQEGSADVTFENLSKRATSYHWEFGDGTTSDLASPTHVFAANGTYHVTLTATNANGSRTFALDQVVRGAAFDPPAGVTTGIPTQFFDLTPALDGGVTAWSWNFGDGSPASSFQSPLHTFANPGTYTVTLTVTDGYGTQTSHSETVAVSEPGEPTGPTAAFSPQGTANAASLEAGAAVQSYSSAYPSHTPEQMLDANLNEYYESPQGLPWATASGTGFSRNEWVKVTLAGGRPYLLNAFAIAPRKCCDGQRVRDFEVAVAMTPPQGASLPDASFTTVLQGTLSNDGSLQAFTLPRPTWAKYVLYRPLNNRGDGCCISTMQFRAYTGTVGGRTVTFDNLSKAFTSATWDFGDGSAPVASTAASVSHTFPAGGGTYDVTLTVTDALGRSDTTTVQQRVLAPLALDFTSAPAAPKEGDTVSFQEVATAGASDDQIVSRRWSYGDGNDSGLLYAGQGASITHPYFENQPYTIKLTATTAWGQEASVEHVITPTNVAPTIDAGRDWRWRKDRPLTFTTSIVDPGIYDVETCTWAYGDGATGTGCTFAHTYAATGDYIAKVTVTDDDGGTGTDTVAIKVLQPTDDSAGGPSSTGRGDVVPGTDVTYTDDNELESATLLNTNHTATANQVQLNRTTKPFPYVYISGTNRGTLIRVDVNTGKILGEYWSAPQNMAKNPSRTTVDQLGNVWITNRDEGSYVPEKNLYMGSIMRAGLVIGGTRSNADGSPNPDGEYLKPPFQYNTCQDRDGDGLLRTSPGYGHILPWPNAAGQDTAGGITTASDECIINFVRTYGTNARTLVLDKSNNIWVGGLGNQWHELIDGVTGQHVPGTEFNLGCGGYGGVMGQNGILFSARGGSGLLRYDTNLRTGNCALGNNQGDYGLGIDPKTGEIWQTYLGWGSDGMVVKMSPTGQELGRYPHGFSNAQGVAVDGDSNVWVAHSLFGAPHIGHIRTDGTFVGNVSLLGETGPTGVAVDANGKVWSANQNSSSASRIDPKIGPIGGGGIPTGYVDFTLPLPGTCTPSAGCLSPAYPYTYSDMTGFVSIGATAPQGFWTVTQDGGAAGTTWGKVTWNTEAAGSVPAGTAIEVQARTADSQEALSSKDWAPVSNGTGFTLVGRYIQVQATLRANSAGDSPVLSDLRVQTVSTNTPPIAADVSVTTHAGVPVGVTLSATDAEGDALTYAIVNGPQHGTLAGTGAQRTYTPAAGYHGPDSFTYRASDGSLDSAPATVSIQVTNAAPVAQADVVTTAHDRSVSGDVRANDGDADGDTTSVVSHTEPSHGTLSLASNGVFTYAPAAGYVGDDSFTYELSDGVTSATGTVTIHVTDAAPAAFDDHFTTVQGGTLQIVGPGVLANDTDADGDALSAVLASQALHGSVTLAGDGGFSYVPEAGFGGTDQFTYRASDGALSSTPVVVRISVDRTPAAVDDELSTHLATPVTLNLLANDTDPDNEPLTIVTSSITQPPHGTLALIAAGLVYTPTAGFVGDDAFSYAVTDGYTASPPARVTIHVTDAAPTAADHAYSVHAGQSLTVAAPGVLAGAVDADGDAVRVASHGASAHGVVSLTPDGAVQYTPGAGYVGDDFFTYRLTDGALESAPATVSVHVVNAAPSAADDAYATHHGAVLHVAAPGVLANDMDSDGDTLTALLVTPGQHGLVTLAPTGELTYVPAPGFVGSDSFTYRAGDGLSAGTVATVTIQVTDAAPVAADDVYVTLQGQALQVADPGVLANDGDADGDPRGFALTAIPPAHGQLALRAAGGFTYVPDPGFHGADSFTYTAGDGALRSAPATVTILVNGAPVAQPDAFSTHEGRALDIAYNDLTSNDTDPEGEPLFVDIASLTVPPHGSLTPTATGVRYQPAAGFVGDDQFLYRVTDTHGLSGTALVTIHVTDTAPTAFDDAYTVHAGVVLHVPVPGPLANDSDPDGDALHVVDVGTPLHGSVTLSAQGELAYTPLPGFVGQDSFAYRIGDAALTSAPATITVDVTDTAPLGAPDEYSTHFGQALHVPAPSVLANDTDADGDALAAAVVGGALHGTASFAADGALTYVPLPGYVGDDLFTYAPNDGLRSGAPVFVTVHVTDAAPVARLDTASGLQGDTIGGNVLANDSDPDGDPLAVALFAPPAHGTATLGPNGDFTYTPAPDYSGADTFTYLLTDGGISVPGTVTITVIARNKPPTVTLAPAGPVDEGAAPITLAASGSDPDAGQTLAYTWSVTANASLTPAGATAQFRSDDGPATATVKVEVCDDGAPVECAKASRDIQIRNVAPTATAAVTPAHRAWGLPFAFNGSATDPSAADTAAGLTPSWSFGDAALALGASVSHVYATPGSYTATFSAVDKDSGRGEARVPVVVDKRTSSLAYIGTTTDPATLSARFADATDAATGSLAGHLVTFTVNGRVYSATTDAAGVATVPGAQTTGGGPVQVAFVGDALYLRSSAQASIAGFPWTWDGTGFFAIGPAAAPVGRTVNFWNSQWPQLNLGDAPNAFKGWVTTSVMPSGCGTSWLTKPGNSGHPPDTLPTYIPVVQTARVTKSGSQIAGNVTHIVIVKVGPGYGGAPGHDGLGQVVATIC